MEVNSKNTDPVIYVRRASMDQVRWLSGLLDINQKNAAELVVDEFIEDHKEELAERSQQFLDRPKSSA